MTFDAMAEDFQQIAFEEFTPANRYKFLTASVVPRPIALVTSLGRNGQVNAAPFSQFVILSTTPPILGIVVGRHTQSFKDTYENILRSGEFVINTVSEQMVEITQLCAIPFDERASETEILGLRTLASRSVYPPLLACSKLAFECTLHRVERFGPSSTLIAGDVVSIQARKGLVDGHRVDHDILGPLGRISGRRYCRTKQVISVGASLDEPYRSRVRADAIQEKVPPNG